MNKKLGMKWFYFFCFIRPWIAFISNVMTMPEHIENMDLYLKVNIYFLRFVLGQIECIMLLFLFFLAMKRGHGIPKRDLFFIRYIRFVIIFEVISFIYNHVISMLEAFSQMSMKAVIIRSLPLAIIVYSVAWGLPNWIYFTKRFWCKISYDMQDSIEE